MKKTHKGTPNQRLKAERELRGWSQKYVADQLGADHYYLSRWERGTASPSPYYRQKLCALFGKNAKELGLLQEEPGEHEEEANEPTLLSSPPTEAVSDPAIPPLSAGTTGLVGRDEVFSQLKERLRGGSNVGLTAINGLPGVGKTTLAVLLAHDEDVLAHFHDGILWAGLGPQPNVLGGLSRWGTLLGTSAIAGARLVSIEAWTQVIRTAIGLRQMLLVIDDAWQIEQALAFKVGGPHTAYLLTTRFPHIALQFAGERAMVIHELSQEESFTLLARLAPEVVASDLEAAHDLIRSAGGLPLALSLMGKYLRTHSLSGQPRRMRAALERLRAVEHRLRLSEPRAMLERSPTLPTGTPLSLQTIIDVSVELVDEQARAALQRLAVFPAKPSTFSEEAALAVCQVPAEALDALTDAGLLESGGPGRYTLHQTIADFARIHLTETMAYERLAVYFADYVQAHSKDYEALEQESSNIFAALQAARSHGHSTDLLRCITALAWFLEARGLYAQAEGYLTQAEEIARSVQESAGLAAVLLHLGKIRLRRGEYDQSETSLQEGLLFARQIGNHRLLCNVTHAWGELHLKQHRWAEATTAFNEVRTMALEVSQEYLAAAYFGLARVAAAQGDSREARTLGQTSLRIAETIGNRLTSQVRVWLEALPTEHQ